MKPRALLFAAAGLALIGGLYFVSPKHGPNDLQTITPTGVASGHESYSLIVRKNKLAEGPAVLRVVKGDKVTIRIDSDVGEELHLHGYDLMVDLKPNVQSQFEFIADRSGRFEYELERSGIELGTMEVLPR